MKSKQLYIKKYLLNRLDDLHNKYYSLEINRNKMSEFMYRSNIIEIEGAQKELYSIFEKFFGVKK